MSATAVLEPRTELAVRTYRLDRGDLVRYAGASRDFNPVHWDEAECLRAGLPGVLAHGMLVMALAARAVVDWTGPGALAVFDMRFTRPVVVGAQGTAIAVHGTRSPAGPDGLAEILVKVLDEGGTVVGRASAHVREDR